MLVYYHPDERSLLFLQRWNRWLSCRRPGGRSILTTGEERDTWPQLRKYHLFWERDTKLYPPDLFTGGLRLLWRHWLAAEGWGREWAGHLCHLGKHTWLLFPGFTCSTWVQPCTRTCLYFCTWFRPGAGSPGLWQEGRAKVQPLVECARLPVSTSATTSSQSVRGGGERQEWVRGRGQSAMLKLWRLVAHLTCDCDGLWGPIVLRARTSEREWGTSTQLGRTRLLLCPVSKMSCYVNIFRCVVSRWLEMKRCHGVVLRPVWIKSNNPLIKLDYRYSTHPQFLTRMHFQKPALSKSLELPQSQEYFPWRPFTPCWTISKPLLNARFEPH